jgi:hypothetical protein
MADLFQHLLLVLALTVPPILLGYLLYVGFHIGNHHEHQVPAKPKGRRGPL